MKIGRLIRRLLFLFVMVCLLTGFTVAHKGYELYRQALKTESLTEQVEAIREKKGFTSFKDLPGVYVNAVVSVEYTKDEIFELYVNCIYFGDGYYSVGEASEGYFNKVPGEMSDYESTLLAGVPNAPSKYAPSKNLRLAQERQKKVIARMEACGYLSAKEAETVSEQIVAFN